MGTALNVILFILAGVGVLSFVFLGFLIVRSAFSGSRKKSKPGARRRETMKMVVWVCLANGFAWVWCSYILAFLDKMQIAESLSQVAVTEIIGVVLAYAIKSAIENLSKNNHWPDKPVYRSDSTAGTTTDDSSTGVG
jgi:threonine/homoserine/homoserine lactone efflux protein